MASCRHSELYTALDSIDCALTLYPTSLHTYNCCIWWQAWNYLWRCCHIVEPLLQHISFLIYGKVKLTQLGGVFIWIIDCYRREYPTRITFSVFLGQLICYFSLGVRYCEMVCDTINSCIEYSASIHYSGLDNKTKHAHFLGNNSKDQRPWERDRDMDYVWMGALSHVNYITKSCLSLVTLSLRYWCSGCWPL